MSRLLFGFTLFMAVIIQAAIFPELGTLQVMPDLTLVLLLVWSALRGVVEGLIWAFGIGLFLDVIALDRLGTNELALLGVALLGGLASQRFFQSTLLFPLVLVVVATFVHAVVLLVLRSASGSGVPLSAVMRVIFLQALLNLMVIPVVYLFARWMERRTVVAHA